MEKLTDLQKRLQTIILLVILKCTRCILLSDIIISLPVELDMHEIHNRSWFSKEGDHVLQEQ